MCVSTAIGANAFESLSRSQDFSRSWSGQSRHQFFCSLRDRSSSPGQRPMPTIRPCAGSRIRNARRCMALMGIRGWD